MLFIVLAFFAGVITVFAPCVFALLPIIVGGSISGNIHDKRRPFIIAASLALSLFLFTLLFKATAVFVNIPPSLITTISGGIVVLLGIVLLFPSLYERLILAFDLQLRSQQLLGKGSSKGIAGAIITGAALGPVFSSCSPVYAYILASVLPVNFTVAIVYMIAYIAGLSLVLLGVGLLGQKLVRKLHWASNPHGWFQRTVAILFIIVGLMVITGYDKQFQTYIADHTALNFDGLSAKLLPSNGNNAQTNADLFNVTPYPAPNFTDISSWINSQPLTISQLKGKVVLVDFWTYSCINCIRTQPYLKDWYQRYHDSGFEIIGVHAPEFSFEKVQANVEQAVQQAGIKYPVAMDNNLTTWQAYNNQYWPASYLIDRNGNVRRTHFGEGEYSQEEQAIRQLLVENGTKITTNASSLSDNVPSSTRETPETYLGLNRANSFIGSPSLQSGTNSYTSTAPKDVNQWTLDGQWNVTDEGITAVQDSVLTFRVAAKDVYLVTGSNTAGQISVELDGKPVSQTGSAGSDITDSKLNVSMAQLYHLVHFDTFRDDTTVTLRVPPGVQLNTFTFGS